MKLFLKKLFTAPLYAGVAFAGMFGFALVLGPFNLPYLLKFPEDSLYIIAGAFSLLFTSVVAVIVRTEVCRKAGLPPDSEKSLLRQVLTFHEYWMELLVFALLSVVFTAGVGIQMQAPFWSVVLVSLSLSVGDTLVFAIFDCLIWWICFKRAKR